MAAVFPNPSPTVPCCRAICERLLERSKSLRTTIPSYFQTEEELGRGETDLPHEDSYFRHCAALLWRKETLLCDQHTLVLLEEDLLGHESISVCHKPALLYRKPTLLRGNSTLLCHKSTSVCRKSMLLCREDNLLHDAATPCRINKKGHPPAGTLCFAINQCCFVANRH